MGSNRYIPPSSSVNEDDDDDEYESREQSTEQAVLDDFADFSEEGESDGFPDFDEFMDGAELPSQDEDGEGDTDVVDEVMEQLESNGGLSDGVGLSGVESETQTQTQTTSESDSEGFTGGIPDSFHETDLTPDAPENANIDNAEEFRAIGEEEMSGASKDYMIVGKDADGNEMYIKRDDNIIGNTMSAVAASEVVSDELNGDVNKPDTFVDNERGASVMADASENETQIAGRSHRNSIEEGFDRDSYAKAAAFKVTMGDTDIGGNIVVDQKTGESSPIDYDLAGSDLERDDASIRESSGNSYDGLWDKVDRRVGGRTTRDLSEDGQTPVTGQEVREAAEELTRGVDADSVEQKLNNNPNVTDRHAQRIADNIRWIQDNSLSE